VRHPVITAVLWAVGILCVAPAAAADAISNASLRVEVAEADGALVVTDLRTKREWRQAVVEKKPAFRAPATTATRTPIASAWASSTRPAARACSLAVGDGMNHPPVYWPLKNLWSVLYGGAPMYRISGARLKGHAEEIRRTYVPPPCPNVFAE
jgi:hypothetical protein